MGILDTINTAYKDIGRTTVDQGGRDYWSAEAVKNNWTDAQLASQIQTAAGGATAQQNAAKIDAGYVAPEVKTAFTSLFNRDDTAGENYWSKQGLTGTALTDAMQTSANAIAADPTRATTGTAVSNFTSSNGLRFDSQGRPVVNGSVTPAITGNPDNTDTAADTTPNTYSYSATNAGVTPAAAATGYQYGAATDTPIDKSTVSSYDPSVANGMLATATTPTKESLEKYKASPDAITKDQVFDAAQGTVAGQTAANMNPNSILAQAAQTEANRIGNKRGLLNASMTATAGTEALFKYATQIGALDAAAYNTRMANNKAATDQFSLTNKAANDRANELTSTSINAMIESNAMRSTDVSKVNAAAEQVAAQLKAASENEAIFRSAASKISVSLANAGFENAAAAFGAAATNASATQYTGNLQQTNLVNANAANAAAAANADAQNKAGIVGASLLSAQTIAKMDDGTKRYLADTQAKYQTLIAASGAASSLSNATMAALNGIAESTMTDAAKKDMYNATVNNYQTAMNLVGSINGVDVTKLLNFQTIT